MTALCGLVLGVGAASAAPITLGGFTFDSTAFPTSDLLISGGPPALSFVSTGNVNTDLQMATDSDLNSFIFGTPVDFNATFGNGAIENGAGADFVIFELGIPDDVTVTVNSVTKTYLTANTGFSAAGFNLNAVAIDLSDFGIAANGLVSTINVNNASPVTGSASIDAIGALHAGTVPEPMTWLPLMGGALLLGMLRLKRAAGTN